MQDEFLSLNMALKYMRSPQIHIWGGDLYHVEPDHSRPGTAEPNHDFTVKSSCLRSSQILHSIEW